MAATRLNPYISFKDNAREAMEFYKSVFGGELALSTFEDFHAASDPSENNLIMHGMLTAPNGMVLMGADTPARMEYKPGTNMSISLSGDEDEELTGYYNKLVEGGHQLEPLVEAPWGDKFGMLTDKFGITWMVNIAKKA